MHLTETVVFGLEDSGVRRKQPFHTKRTKMKRLVISSGVALEKVGIKLEDVSSNPSRSS